MLPQYNGNNNNIIAAATRRIITVVDWQPTTKTHQMTMVASTMTKKTTTTATAAPGNEKGPLRQSRHATNKKANNLPAVGSKHYPPITSTPSS